MSVSKCNGASSLQLLAERWRLGHVPRAQKSLPRIGWLVFGDAKLGPIDQSLKDALAQAGLIDGRNVEIVFRYAEGMSDRLPELATELVAQKPTLLLAVGGDVIKPLFEASKGGIPIVGGVSDSPMRAGIAVSTARPGKNFTGITFLTDEMAGKPIELLKEVAPRRKARWRDIQSPAFR
jgi:putative ABC transport system substrate-binding protein